MKRKPRELTPGHIRRYADHLRDLARPLCKSGYGQYLLELAK